MEFNNDDKEFTFLCIYSKDTKVLIVGGGNCALIKVRSFLNKGFSIDCISPKFKEEILRLKNENLKLIKGEFTDELIFNYHLIIICTNSEQVNSHIRDLCKKNYKVFIDTTIPEKSNATLCATASTNNIKIGISTINKSPKTSKFLVKKVHNYLINYDEYVSFVTAIRNKVLENFPRKNELLDFISTDDFFYFYNMNYGDKVLKLFFGGYQFEVKNSYKKK